MTGVFQSADCELERLANIDEHGGEVGPLEQLAGLIDVYFERIIAAGGGRGRGFRGGRRFGRGGAGRAARGAGGIARHALRGECASERIVGEHASDKRFAAARDELDHFHRLKAADDAAQRSNDAGFAATGHGSRGRRRRKQTTVARAAGRRMIDRELAGKFENTAMHQRPPGANGGVVAEVARGKIVRAVDDDIVGRKESVGIFRRHGGVNRVDRDFGVERAEPTGGGIDFEPADGGGVVEELALEVVPFHAVRIDEADGADAGGGKVEGDGAAEAPGADNQHARGTEAFLAGHADFAEQQVPTVAGKLRGGEGHGRVNRRQPGRRANEIALVTPRIALWRDMAQKFVVILAGGKGERFWPLSRLRCPKQLLPIVGDRPMLAQTVARVLPVVPPENVFILTNVDQAVAVRRACPELPRGNIVAEPVGRDSGPAVGLAAELVAARDPKGVFASLHADAAIHNEKAFQSDLRVAFSAAAAAPVMVTIGVKPHEPSTGYGYIQRGKAWRKVRGVTVAKARRFVEKPAADVAERYLKSGDYYWNTGIFVWRASVVQEAFRRNTPELHEGLARIGAALAAGQGLARALRKIYPTLPRIAVDYALLEKADNVVMLRARFDWDDVGSWAAIARHHARDARQNTIVGDGVVEEGSGNIVVSGEGHVTAVFGVDDLVVVHTSDATLVCPRSKTEEIKALLKRIAADPRGPRLL